MRGSGSSSEGTVVAGGGDASRRTPVEKREKGDRDISTAALEATTPATASTDVALQKLLTDVQNSGGWGSLGSAAVASATPKIGPLDIVTIPGRDEAIGDDNEGGDEEFLMSQLISMGVVPNDQAVMN